MSYRLIHKDFQEINFHLNFEDEGHGLIMKDKGAFHYGEIRDTDVAGVCVSQSRLSIEDLLICRRVTVG